MWRNIGQSYRFRIIPRLYHAINLHLINCIKVQVFNRRGEFQKNNVAPVKMAFLGLYVRSSVVAFIIGRKAENGHFIGFCRITRFLVTKNLELEVSDNLAIPLVQINHQFL